MDTVVQAYGPVPSERQLIWHRYEFYGFLHFGINTFSDREWGFGDESPETFNPSDFDADQMASVAAAAGMSGLILTCKHHDGFCLWPSRYTEYSVKNSPWRKGEGDVVREVSEACRRRGLKFGAYLSPWDRNHGEYGRPGYLGYYRNQLEELTSEYGELFEVWFDGANGGDGYYGGARETRQIDRRSYYDWENTWKIVRRNQPSAVMFSDAGPDIRWVGNEEGIAGEPCWSTLTKERLYPGFGGDGLTALESDMVEAWGSDKEMLNQGDRKGRHWLPAECDVSIRPGWFYHQGEDAQVRSPKNLVDLYFQSVGRGAALLLNLPPDRRGRIHENDVQALMEMRTGLSKIFDTNLAVGAGISVSGLSRESCHGPGSNDPKNLIDGNRETFWISGDTAVRGGRSRDASPGPSVILTFRKPVTFNVISVREHLPLGQRIDNFAVDVDVHGSWQEYACVSGVGNRRLIRGAVHTTPRIRLRIVESTAPPALTELGVHLDP